MRKIEQLPGVAEVQLNFGAGLIKAIHQNTSVEDIIRLINVNGYDARVQGESQAVLKTAGKLRTRMILAVVSGVMLGAGLIISWIGWAGNFHIYLFAAAMAAGGYYVYKSALNSLQNLILDMNVLMSISSVGAVFLGQWSEGATVVFLFSVGNLLQAHTMDKTRNSIKKMMQLSPKEARVIAIDGSESMVPVDTVGIGNTVLVKPGESIPVDGFISKGRSWVNQASITGESKPLEKTAGDEVFAGTLNQDGSLYIKCTHLAADSTLKKMTRMVEEAQAKKAPTQQYVDIFAKYYTPLVIIGAVFVVAVPVVLLGRPFAEWFYKALVLLVISCPCALVISTPVSIVSAIGNAARNGVLIKGGAYLEALGKAKNIAFDKTGTVTTGIMSLTDIFPFGGIGSEQLLQAAGAVERFSEHPLAMAVMAEVSKRKIILPDSDSFRAFPGKGAVCRVEGKELYVGNKWFINGLGISIGDVKQIEAELEKAGKSIVYVTTSKRVLGILGIEDVPRAFAGKAIKQLKQIGIEKIVMLSGDNEATAANIAGRLGIREYRANLLPEDKVKEIETLTWEGDTVMVGDGVNDAPALAVADVGIAMGAAGSDTALETADIALMNDELLLIPAVIKLGRRTRAVILQNVFLAIALKIIFLVLTFAGISNLWMAVFADTGASVLVTLNGMRLARHSF
ncbi:heavy metal translocating P-type ATPase [Phosphitispora sp. TUW77]|uniref:heavy metal translocating P-type ATPase n=1 Tax=Phosphitispora sp. TUW77 TaxID=3152361 RepID=UPI003AB64F61